MRIGLFCTYENPVGDQRAAYAAQTRLVEHAEALGFDEAWIAEHHFNPDALSPSCLPIMAYLAAKTRRMRLGSAAVLLPCHSPLKVAEDLATLDLLSDGRLDFGVGKGGPFPMQNKHFGLAPEEARGKLAEGLDLVSRLLYEENVSFNGRYYQADGINLQPKPLQRPIPTYLATSTRETVLQAAHHGYGIMAGPPFPLAQVADSVAAYRSLAGAAQDPNLILIRFYHVALSEQQAKEEARQLLKGFAERMAQTTAKLQPSWAGWFDIERLIEDSLIGTPDQIAAKAQKIARDLNPRSLILKQFRPDMACRADDLTLFISQIQPELLAA